MMASRTEVCLPTGPAARGAAGALRRVAVQPLAARAQAALEGEMAISLRAIASDAEAGPRAEKMPIAGHAGAKIAYH